MFTPYLSFMVLNCFVFADHSLAMYKFDLDTETVVAYIYSDRVVIGKFDVNGLFYFEKSQPRKGILSGEAVVSKSLADRYVNVPARKDRKIYMLFSDTLIEGSINDSGNFIPTNLIRTTKFKNYRFGLFAIPIMNLPGKFLPRK